MLKCFKKINKKDTGVFAAGRSYSEQQVLNCFTKQRCQETLHKLCSRCSYVRKSAYIKTATTIQENAEDIYAEAQQINEERAAEDAEEYADVEDARSKLKKYSRQKQI